MNKETQEYFGEVISVYTREQGIKDGLLMKNPSTFFLECDLITTNLWNYIEERVKNSVIVKPIDLLDCLMRKADDIYVHNNFEGDNDKNFFVIKGNGHFKSVWFVRNEHNKLTAMLPEDY